MWLGAIMVPSVLFRFSLKLNAMTTCSKHVTKERVCNLHLRPTLNVINLKAASRLIS